MYPLIVTVDTITAIVLAVIVCLLATGVNKPKTSAKYDPVGFGNGGFRYRYECDAMIHKIGGATIAALVIAGFPAPADARRYQPSSSPLPIAATTGVPTSIYDGDTFRFGKLRVRVWGVDAPELETQFGAAARAELVQLVADRRVTCRDTGQRSYDRIVAQCWNWRGIDIAAAMARTGWAVNWSTYSRGRYLADQQAAQRERRGVFAYGVQPWR